MVEHAKAKEAIRALKRQEFMEAKPSQKIRMAIEDVKAVRASEKYVFDMGLWVQERSFGRCAVCVAGAVMANRMDCLNHGLDPLLDYNISLLNGVRTGGGSLVQTGLRWGLSSDEVVALASIIRSPPLGKLCSKSLQTEDFEKDFDHCIECLEARAFAFESVGA